MVANRSFFEMTNQTSAETLIAKLAAYFAAHDLDAYLVGGYVRSYLLSLPPERDLDIAVAGDPARIAADLAKELGGRTVPLSPSRRMVRIVLSAAPEGDGAPEASHPWTVDLAALAGDIEQDLGRRDFSINAMALSLRHWDEGPDTIIDPLDGRQDLAQRCIRALGPGVFESDPGRLMRGVRLAGQLGFRMDPDTVRLIARESHRVSDVSPDRVREEFLTIISQDGAKAQIEALDRLGLLNRIIPELEAGKGVDQPNAHYWDVWGHTLHAVEAAELVTKGHQHSPIYSCVPWNPESEAHFNQIATDGHTRRTVLKLAALFHDIAKPQTKQVQPDGRTRFFGHSEQGAEIASDRLRQLRVSSRGIAMVSKMVEEHLRPATMMRGDNGPTNRAIHRFFRDLGDVAVDTLYLCLADHLAAKGPELSHQAWLNHARMVAQILHVGTHGPDSPTNSRIITGRDLMAHFDLQPGPEIGALLEKIEEALAAGEIETQEQALELAAQDLRSKLKPEPKL